jgi:hypothetical protein
MKNIITLILISTCSLLFHSCENNPIGSSSYTTEATDGELIGVVADSLGGPLAGVNVYYIFHFDPVASPVLLTTNHLHSSQTDIASTPESPAKTLPTTSIEFDLPFDTVVSMTLLRYGTRELLATIVDHQHLAAGRNEVQFDVSHYTNGLYLVDLIIGNSSIYWEATYALLIDTSTTNPTMLYQTTPLTTTSSEGNFTLPLSELGIGVVIPQSDFNGGINYIKVSSSIDVVLYKKNYTPVIIPMTIDPKQSAYVIALMQ